MNITNLDPACLKEHARNTEFFDDITADDYARFKDSINNEGILTPLVVAPDMTVISGHQRLHAAIDLGLKTVPVIINESLSDEDSKLRALIAANFGRLIQTNSPKWTKATAEYVKLVGNQNGGNRKSECLGDTLKKSWDDIAKELGISRKKLSRAIAIENKLSEPLKERFYNGEIGFNLAADLLSSLPEHEQMEIFQNLPAGKKVTKREVDEVLYYLNEKDKAILEKDELIEKQSRLLKNKEGELAAKDQLRDAMKREIARINNELEDASQKLADSNMKIKQLENTPPRVETRTVEVRDKNDVLQLEENSKRIKNLAAQVNNAERKLSWLEKENERLSRQSQKDADEIEKFNKLKSDIEFLSKKKSDLKRQIKSATELSELTVQIQDMLETKLAPIKFKRTMETLDIGDVAVQNILEVLDRVDSWSRELRDIVGNNDIIV